MTRCLTRLLVPSKDDRRLMIVGLGARQSVQFCDVSRIEAWLLLVVIYRFHSLIQSVTISFTIARQKSPTGSQALIFDVG